MSKTSYFATLIKGEHYVVPSFGVTFKKDVTIEVNKKMADYLKGNAIFDVKTTAQVDLKKDAKKDAKKEV